MANKKEHINSADLLQAFRNFKVQYFLVENHLTGTKVVYEGLSGLVTHKNIITLHGPESCSITRLDPDIGKILYGKQQTKDR